jgi:8-oxo-dGTP pyrophosphatase MutT (NUDIX family)
VERSAGGVVIRRRDGEAHVLLILDPYRKWGLPKGHLEEGEGEPEAALREVREETGLTELVLGPDLGEIDWTFRRLGRRVHKFCRFFLMHAPAGDTRPELSEGITECRWLPVDQAVEKVTYDNAREVILKARKLVERGRDDPDLPWRE